MTDLIDALLAAAIVPLYLVILVLFTCGSSLYQCEADDSKPAQHWWEKR